MTLTTSTITGRVPLPTDEDLQYAELLFTLSGLDTEGANVLPGGISKRVVLIDSDIPAGFDLWQNTAGLRGTHYRVLARWTVKDRDGIRDQYADLGIVQVGADASYTLAALLNYAVPSAPASFWSSITQAEYDAVMQARDDAAASAVEASQYGGYRVNAKFEKSLGIATDGSRVGITSEAVHIVPTSLLQIVNKQISTGLRCSSYWTGTALTPFQNNDNSLWETYNKTVNNSLNLSWSISAPNAYNDIPAGVRDAGERVGVFGWATSVNIPGEYEHKGTLASQVGVKGRAGFQGDINLSPAGAVIESAVGVKGEVRGESPAAVIEKAYAGHFTSLDSSVTDVRDNVAIYAEASGGSISNYSFLGQAGELHNRERVLFGDGSIVAAQSASIVSARATAPNALEFGNGDSSGYGCNIGATAPSGMPFIAFCAEAETSGNTFRTRGKKGMTISASFTGEMVFGQLTNANAGGQTITEKARFDSDGKLRLTETIVLRSATPSSATASGVQGEFRWDANYLYICVEPNTWKRAAVATW